MKPNRNPRNKPTDSPQSCQEHTLEKRASSTSGAGKTRYPHEED
jgi:hypothetical protein